MFICGILYVLYMSFHFNVCGSAFPVPGGGCLFCQFLEIVLERSVFGFADSNTMARFNDLIKELLVRNSFNPWNSIFIKIIVFIKHSSALTPGKKNRSVPKWQD